MGETVIHLLQGVNDKIDRGVKRLGDPEFARKSLLKAFSQN